MLLLSLMQDNDNKGVDIRARNWCWQGGAGAVTLNLSTPSWKFAIFADLEVSHPRPFSLPSRKTPTAGPYSCMR